MPKELPAIDEVASVLTGDGGVVDMLNRLQKALDDGANYRIVWHYLKMKNGETGCYLGDPTLLRNPEALYVYVQLLDSLLEKGDILFSYEVRDFLRGTLHVEYKNPYFPPRSCFLLAYELFETLAVEEWRARLDRSAKAATQRSQERQEREKPIEKSRVIREVQQQRDFQPDPVIFPPLQTKQKAFFGPLLSYRLAQEARRHHLPPQMDSNRYERDASGHWKVIPKSPEGHSTCQPVARDASEVNLKVSEVRIAHTFDSEHYPDETAFLFVRDLGECLQKRQMQTQRAPVVENRYRKVSAAHWKGMSSAPPAIREVYARPEVFVGRWEAISSIPPAVTAVYERPASFRRRELDDLCQQKRVSNCGQGFAEGTMLILHDYLSKKHINPKAISRILDFFHGVQTFLLKNTLSEQQFLQWTSSVLASVKQAFEGKTAEEISLHYGSILLLYRNRRADFPAGFQLAKIRALTSSMMKNAGYESIGGVPIEERYPFLRKGQVPPPAGLIPMPPEADTARETRATTVVPPPTFFAPAPRAQEAVAQKYPAPPKLDEETLAFMARYASAPPLEADATRETRATVLDTVDPQAFPPVPTHTIEEPKRLPAHRSVMCST